MSSTFLGFSTTPASNTAVNGIGIQGTNAVNNFDNAFREFLAIFRRDLDGRMVLTTKSAGYTAVANDNNAIIRFSAAATLSLTAAATLGSGWHCWVMADGGAVIIDPNSTETINGATTITIPDGYSTLVICDGTNFRALEDYAQVDNWVDVASATTTDIGAVASQNVRITGTTTITGLGTVAAGIFRRVRFAASLTLTYNATSLILPGLANITTAAGDVGEFISEGSGNWRCVSYQRAVPAGATAWIGDQKTAGSAGGASVATTWTTRDLNTEFYDPLGIVTISSNQFTPAFNCFVEWSTPCFQTGAFKSRLYNVTDGVSAAEGTAAFSVNGTDTAQSVSTGFGIVTAGKAYRIEYYATSAKTVNGLGTGVGSGAGVPVFTEIRLRVAP